MDPLFIILGILLFAFLAASRLKEAKDTRARSQPNLPPIKHYEVQPTTAYKLTAAGLAGMLLACNSFNLEICAIYLPKNSELYLWVAAAGSLIGFAAGMYVVFVTAVGPGKPVYVTASAPDSSKKDS
jgi:hypothetical protein